MIGNESTLKEIGVHYKTDKVDRHHTFRGLTYLDIYERYFQHLRNREASVLEIGVKGGASLKTWKSYFRQARIFGIDIDPACKTLEEDRIQVEIGSQDDPKFLRTCFGEDTKFDVILDDGSHINSMTIASFENLFDSRLNSGGVYIMEDLHCTYEKLQTNHNILESWPGMKYNDPEKSYDNDRADMDNFFAQKIRDLDYHNGNILCFHFWPRTCVILKV